MLVEKVSASLWTSTDALSGSNLTSAPWALGSAATPKKHGWNPPPYGAAGDKGYGTDNLLFFFLCVRLSMDLHLSMSEPGSDQTCRARAAKSRNLGCRFASYL